MFKNKTPPHPKGYVVGKQGAHMKGSRRMPVLIERENSGSKKYKRRGITWGTYAHGAFVKKVWRAAENFGCRSRPAGGWRRPA